MKAFGKILGLIFLGLLLIIVAAGFALTTQRVSQCQKVPLMAAQAQR